jgi:hypothetical protein
MTNEAIRQDVAAQRAKEFSEWARTQYIEKGIEIVPLRARADCDEWVLRTEADRRIAELEAENRAYKTTVYEKENRELYVVALENL